MHGMKNLFAIVAGAAAHLERAPSVNNSRKILNYHGAHSAKTVLQCGVWHVMVHAIVVPSVVLIALRRIALGKFLVGEKTEDVGVALLKGLESAVVTPNMQRASTIVVTNAARLAHARSANRNASWKSVA